MLQWRVKETASDPPTLTHPPSLPPQAWGSTAGTRREGKLMAKVVIAVQGMPAGREEKKNTGNELPVRPLATTHTVKQHMTKTWLKNNVKSIQSFVSETDALLNLQRFQTSPHSFSC